MRLRTCSAPLLLLLLSACATMEPSPGEWEDPSPRLANLQRAALYPWTDDGQCVVGEASTEWPILAERCFHALDRDRVRFRDVSKRCAVAYAGADAAAPAAVALCIFAAPEIVAGAVIVIGAVVVAAAVQEGIDAYERNASRERAKPKAQTRPSREQEPVTESEPAPRGLGRDWFPPDPPDLEPRDRRPECTPRRAPPKGGHPLHNKCADAIPGNAFRGANALVNGKAFDALQPTVRMLWEVKTTAIETYNPFVQRAELNKQIEDARSERALAAACGYEFRIGVRSEAHKELLERAARDLTGLIVVMDWC
jgi:hypothetical protein